MPELPEVETVCRGLAAAITGSRLDHVTVNRRDLRTPVPTRFASQLTGRRVTSVRRRAKYMLWDLDDQQVVIGHLGMSGRIVISTPPPPPRAKHDHLIFTFEGGLEVRFNDARRFGSFALASLDDLDDHPALRQIGPEPLSNHFSPGYLSAALDGKSTSIKAALLDQRIVAGLGNIYVSEALYRAEISPVRQAKDVRADEMAGLVDAIRTVLHDAIAAGGSTLRDYAQASGELGYFQHSFSVYDRAGVPCPACASAGMTCSVQRIVQQGRSTFYCSTRQV